MPAPSSSQACPVIGYLAVLAGDARQDPPGLLAVLARVSDPRRRRGVRHRLAVILSLTVCAVLAGACSYTAIAEWAADADEATLDALGVSGAAPSESTFRRTLQRLDADAFDALAGQWAAQAIQIVRRRRLKGKKWSTETCYAITSLTVTQASTAGLAAIIRGHWAIEDRLHWVRDMDFGEDRSQVRTASGPRVMASLRNLFITILRLAGAASIAAALRHHARRPCRPLRTLMTVR